MDEQLRELVDAVGMSPVPTCPRCRERVHPVMYWTSTSITDMPPKYQCHWYNCLWMGDEPIWVSYADWMESVGV